MTYNPGAGTATWTNLDGNTGPMGDLPTTDLVRDDVSGDLSRPASGRPLAFPKRVMEDLPRAAEL